MRLCSEGVRRSVGRLQEGRPEALQGELVTFVAGLEAELFVEPVSVGTALVGRELHKIAPSRLELGDRPFKHLLA